jgi:hypothetical protein
MFEKIRVKFLVSLTWLGLLLCLGIAFVRSAGQTATYAPLVYKADQATATPSPSPTPTAPSPPTATQVPAPTPDGGDIINGDFEQGTLGWQWAGGFGESPVLTVKTGLGESPEQGGGAARLGEDTSTRLTQALTIPVGRPILVYSRKVRDAYSGCSYPRNDGVVSVYHYPTDSVVSDTVSLCREWSGYGWQQRHVDLTAFAGQEVQLSVIAEVYSGGSEFYWVDNFRFESNIPPFDPPVSDGSPMALEVSIYRGPERMTLAPPPEGLYGWYVQDSEQNRFVFPQTFASTITLYTGVGTNTASTLYWNLDYSVWTDDCATLFDGNGLIRGARCLNTDAH